MTAATPKGWHRFPAPPNTQIDTLQYSDKHGWLSTQSTRTDKMGMTNQSYGGIYTDFFWRFIAGEDVQGTPQDWGF